MAVIVRCPNNKYPVLVGVLNNIYGYYDDVTIQKQDTIGSCFDLESGIRLQQKFDIVFNRDPRTYSYTFDGIATPIIPDEISDAEFVVSAHMTEYFRFRLIQNTTCHMQMNITSVTPGLTIQMGELLLIEA